MLLAVFASTACAGKRALPVTLDGPSSTLSPNAAAYAIVHRFAGGSSGAGPEAPVAIVDGKIYAPTASGGSATPNCGYNCGLVFSMATSGASYTVLYRFLGNADGTTPYSKLAVDGNGALYGTALGGAYPQNGGILYKVAKTKKGWKKTVLHTFSLGSDMDTPNAVILDKATSTLYGTTQGVHSGDCCGTVFSIKTDGTAYKILHTFQPGSIGHGSADGAQPLGALVRDPKTGALYGVAAQAGKVTKACFDGCGTVFKLTPKGASYAFSVVYRFSGGSQPQSPNGPLIIAPSLQSGHTLFYGTTNGGGYPGCLGTGSTAVGCGTVYSITDAGSVRILYAFHGPQENDGEFPESGVTQAGSYLYGVTRLGGVAPYAVGNLYRVGTNGKGYAIVHNFNEPGDGTQPYGEPALYGGSIYGTTFEGPGTKTCAGDSTPGCGTIWRYTP